MNLNHIQHRIENKICIHHWWNSILYCITSNFLLKVNYSSRKWESKDCKMKKSLYYNTNPLDMCLLRNKPHIHSPLLDLTESRVCICHRIYRSTHMIGSFPGNMIHMIWVHPILIKLAVLLFILWTSTMYFIFQGHSLVLPFGILFDLLWIRQLGLWCSLTIFRLMSNNFFNLNYIYLLLH